MAANKASSSSSSVCTAQSYSEIMAAYNPAANTTSRELTKFELAQVVGLRMEQLARNAPAFVDTDDIARTAAPLNDKLMKVAMRELAQKAMPFVICRTLPGGSRKEYWRVCDMHVPNILPMA